MLETKARHFTFEYPEIILLIKISETEKKKKMGHSKLGRRCWELSPSLSQSHPPTSVTRLADLFLDFVQLFRALGDNYFPKSPTFRGNFSNGVKIYHFSREIILGNFYRHLVIFFLSHCPPPKPLPSLSLVAF